MQSHPIGAAECSGDTTECSTDEEDAEAECDDRRSEDTIPSTEIDLDTATPAKRACRLTDGSLLKNELMTLVQDSLQRDTERTLEEQASLRSRSLRTANYGQLKGTHATLHMTNTDVVLTPTMSFSHPFVS